MSEYEQNIVPYDFAVDGEDCLFVDLKSGLLKKVTSVNTSEVVEKTQGTTVNIGKSGEILTCGDNYVQIYKDNEICLSGECRVDFRDCLGCVYCRCIVAALLEVEGCKFERIFNLCLSIGRVYQ